MKQIIKKQRKGRKKFKRKVSSIAKKIAGSTKSHIRRIIRKNNEFPNSVKVGAGCVTARRALPNLILHKRNHRNNKVVGFN